MSSEMTLFDRPHITILLVADCRPNLSHLHCGDPIRCSARVRGLSYGVVMRDHVVPNSDL